MVPSMPRLLSCLIWVAIGAAAQADAPGTPAAQAELLKVSTLQLQLPSVALVRQSGRQVSLPDDLNDGRPVVLNFIFTSCEAICPLMTQTLARFQQLLGTDSAEVHIVSLSIDPEEDTPARLRAYAEKFHAAAGWTFYTGTPEASVTAQKAFNVYRGDKMSHTAVIFMRSSPQASWRRLDGFATAEDLLHEYRAIVASR